jgi:hypothetical protein
VRENEAAAHELVRTLGAAGVAATVSGGGVHWKVEVTNLVGYLSRTARSA